MQQRWIDPPVITPPPALLDTVGGDALLASLLVQRGITRSDHARRFLDPVAYVPASPYDLPDMEQAAARIECAIRDGEIVLVWGDFDVDGQTSTALLVEALGELGASTRYYIPQRQTEGHGVHVARLNSLINDGAQLVVTCDTGIAAHDAVNAANQRGIDVVITDHHQLPDELPAAAAAINPQRLPEGHPLRTLPGVGAAYKLVEALYARAGRAGEEERFLDLVAMGIVADVAVQVDDARYLLQCGLEILRRTSRIGLDAVIEAGGFVKDQLNEGHIGFGLAPRFNALGRLGDANQAVELLTTSDLARARILANSLEGLNSQRKLDTDQIFEAAQRQIERQPELLHDAALVLAHESWEGGVIGIVANRLVELYHRPVILLSTPPGEPARGSARSVPGVDITAALNRLDAEKPGLLLGYGGHTMAAGMSLPADRVDEFRRALGRILESVISPEAYEPSLHIDAYIPLAEISLELVERLERLAPFGPGNTVPLLATQRLRLKSRRDIGRDGSHMRLTVEDERGDVQNVIWWRAQAELLPPGRFDLAYSVRANDYAGNREVQAELVAIRPVDEEPQEFSQRSTVEVIDYRHLLPDEKLAKLAALDHALIWNEGAAIPGAASVRRDDLRRASILAIWTVPPGPDELKAALETVNPATVYLFARLPETDQPQTFLTQLAGLVKHAMNTRASVTPAQLAARLAHRESTVRAGIAWLEAAGHIAIKWNEDTSLRFIPPATSAATAEDAASSSAAQKRLNTLLKETTAYRNHFRRADPRSLITQ